MLEELNSMYASIFSYLIYCSLYFIFELPTRAVSKTQQVSLHFALCDMISCKRACFYFIAGFNLRKIGDQFI